MKLKLCAVFCLLVFPFAGAMPFAHSNDFGRYRELHILDKLIAGDKITYCFNITITEGQKPMSDIQLLRRLEGSLDMWTRYAAHIIREETKKQAREGEFDDILAILDKKITVEPSFQCGAADLRKSAAYNWVVSHHPKPDITFADISFIYDNDYCYKYRNNFRVFPIPSICLYNKIHNLNKDVESSLSKITDNQKFDFNEWMTLKNLLQWRGYYVFSTIAHEIGHAIGLGDQYEDALDNNDPDYATKKPRKGLMQRDNIISCDDVDGLITLIDRARGTSRKFDSLCGDGLVFENGKEVEK